MDVPGSNIGDSAVKERVLETIRALILSQEKVDRIIGIFGTELELGLESGLAASSLQMENTYVPELLTGKEEGKFLALDLGSTNFRILEVTLAEGKIVGDPVIEFYHVPDDKRLGAGTELFDFFAQCILDFMSKHGLKSESLPLGFTFSFPMTQQALNSGVLVSWTKSFNASGVEGTDVAKLLSDAIQRVGDIDVEVMALLNDTTGTLVMGSYDEPTTCIGLILGTGCNGAYIEKVDAVKRWEGERYDAQEVIVDPEFGAFGDNGCIDFVKSEFDIELDRASLLPGKYTYEKYIGGKFCGELVRLALKKLSTNGLLFVESGLSEAFDRVDAFSTADMSAVESDNIANGTKNTENILKRLDQSFTKTDVEVVKFVCALMTERVALLAAVPVACLINRMGKDMASVAVTGSVYRLHPRLKLVLEKYIGRMVDEAREFKTFLSDDGSGKGAALIAAIAKRLKAH